ncbi:glutamate 5-kinase [Fulvimarina sp. 2208YS6-2-32]|uniref:Glutamate 5-kinase n=1 Tax=Fulvimarina uroteuthidis TaxID=3098149 RepID=A0ABU5I0T8_9HYPH|nr:glutamate 5-kinase [Fulvimarina sp. 2208YS6-2-32]MDY8108685.1 glutamate 5-kinase [Fulvimarina sp. 2208YS6-2-32]
MTFDLSRYKRITIKIGSALLVDRGRGLRRVWLESLCEDVARLAAQGHQILIVSSGAVAMGRTLLKIAPGPLKLEESQAAAAVGQIALSRTYSEMLSRHNFQTGQILLTLNDTEHRRAYLNARATIGTLLSMRAIPVINENDTVATSEIRYGDNDRLAARVATMVDADLLILLSDVDGLYTAPPALDPEATHIPLVEKVTPEIDAMAGAAASEYSRGGMKTKMDAARIATASGTEMIITLGHRLYPLAAIENGGRLTRFLASGNPQTARKRWISGHLSTSGGITIDDGAVRALKQGKSLLPKGITKVSGTFRRGDTVAVLDQSGNEVACGLITYDNEDASIIAGLHSDKIGAALGYEGRNVVIHRDDMVVNEFRESPNGLLQHE